MSKELHLTNNHNLLKEVQNQSQLNMQNQSQINLDHINSQNSNILQQNLKNKLEGDNLSQISQDMDIKPNFNKGLNNLNISLSMDNNNSEREQDNNNNSDSQIMQLNNLLKNTNKNDSLNTKNLSIGNTFQAGLLQMAA